MRLWCCPDRGWRHPWPLPVSCQCQMPINTVSGGSTVVGALFCPLPSCVAWAPHILFEGLPGRWAGGLEGAACAVIEAIAFGCLCSCQCHSPPSRLLQMNFSIAKRRLDITFKFRLSQLEFYNLLPSKLCPSARIVPSTGKYTRGVPNIK